jgi:hypothetical protein
MDESVLSLRFTMERLQITVSDEHTKNLVIRLLHSIDGVKISEKRPAHMPDPASSLKSLSGIWKNRDISLQDIRNKAWKRPAL